MNSLKIKIKEVYLPILLVSIGTILFYILLRWTLDIKLGILPLKDDLLSFWIPWVLPWIPIMLWLRRRIRILKIGGIKKDGHFLYQFVVALTIAIPIIVSQNYIEKGSFDLVYLNSIDEIENFPNEKYFKINSFQIDRNSCLPYVTSRTSGKNNEYLTFHAYISCPFVSVKNVWYGVQFNRNLSNRKSADEKEYQYRNFLEKTGREFDSFNFQNVAYFEKLTYSDDRDGFMEAIQKKNPSKIDKKQVILIPKYDDFDQRLGTTLPWVFGSFGIGALILLIMILIPKIDTDALTRFQKNKPLKDDDLKDLLEIFDPRGPNQATAILLLLNILIFIIMIFSGLNIISPTPQELLEIGGNRRWEVLNGEYWRLLTSVFIHSGIIHLMMNLIGLGIGGVLLEQILGRVRLFVVFIVCGISASLASIYWHENTISVGASGAVFGLFGIILAFAIFKVYPNRMRGITWKLITGYIGLSLLFGFFGGIDNAAHIGGLLSGFIVGTILTFTEKEALKKKAN